jgi:hypothetical protein
MSFSSYTEFPDEMVEKPGRFKRFFFACAGAYLRILELCPSEHSKYVGIGATIFLTACMAVLSGTFAIYTLIENVFIALIFGLLWGAMIFNLDRYIVSSIRKEGKPLNEFLLAIPRIILAVLISIVITKPIEVELFRNQIESGISVVVNQERKRAEDDLTRKLGLDSIQHEIDQLDSMRMGFKRMKEGKPTSFGFSEVSQDYIKAKTSFDSIQAIYLPRIKANDTRRNSLWERHASPRYKTNEEGQNVRVGWNIDDVYANEINQLAKVNREMQSELKRRQTEVELLDKERRGERERYAQGVDEELSMIQSRREELNRLKAEKEAIRNTQLPLDMAKAETYSKGFPAKIKALEEMKQSDASIWWMSNLIVLLFIMLETSPIFVKLISKRGPYDYLLSRIEHHKKIESLRYISDMNYDLNAAIRLRNRQAALPQNNGSAWDREEAQN